MPLFGTAARCALGVDWLRTTARGPSARASYTLGRSIFLIRPCPCACLWVRLRAYTLSDHDRTKLGCPVAGACGGCPHAERSYSEQLFFKRDHVLDLLVQADIEHPKAITHPAPATRGYRRRMRMAVDTGGQARFFNEQKALDCAVLEPALRALCQRMVGLGRAYPTALAGYQYLELRSPDLDGRPALFLTESARPPSAVPADLLRQYIHHELLVGSTTDGAAWQRIELLHNVYGYGPCDAFLQVNATVNAQLLHAILAWVDDLGVESFFDLCCGMGNYTLPLLSRGLAGAAVELQASSVSALSQAAHEQGWQPDLAAMGMSHWLELQQQRQAAPPLLIANPPRAGLGKAAQQVARLGCQHVFLVSCNPPTLIKDLKVFISTGFAIEGLQFFDMFPWTRHIETLLWLRRPVS
jgi:23S rRNA (uracil1939-C5)-methyltransferase